MESLKIKTRYCEDVLESEESMELFRELRDSIPWVDGIPSRTGPTRKARSVGCDYMKVKHPRVWEAIVNALYLCDVRIALIKGIYLNYYRDGNDWTPGHNHPKSMQLVLSLGGPRILTVGKKIFSLKSGSAIVFGSSQHSVPKEEIAEPRISIALFLDVPRKKAWQDAEGTLKIFHI